MKPEFRKDLEVLLNKHSIDNMCEMPDFVLMELLVGIIDKIAIANRQCVGMKRATEKPLNHGTLQ